MSTTVKCVLAILLTCLSGCINSDKPPPDSVVFPRDNK